MSWADIQRAIFGEPRPPIRSKDDEFYRRTREDMGVPRSQWTSDEIGMPIPRPPAALSGLSTAPNLGIPTAAPAAPLYGMPEAQVPTATPPGYAPDPNRGLPPTMASTTPFGPAPAVPPAASMTMPQSAPFSIGRPDWMFAPPSAGQTPPQARQPVAGPAQVAPEARQAPMPSRAPASAPAASQAAPQATSGGFESYRYMDDNGREVYGTRRVGVDHENGYGWANADSGTPWKGLLG